MNSVKSNSQRLKYKKFTGLQNIVNRKLEFDEEVVMIPFYNVNHKTIE